MISNVLTMVRETTAKGGIRKLGGGRGAGWVCKLKIQEDNGRSDGVKHDRSVKKRVES